MKYTPAWTEKLNLTTIRGWMIAGVRFDYFFSARAMFLGMGTSVDVLEQIALRKSPADFSY